MSTVNMQMKLVSATKSKAEYKVLSSDFNKGDDKLEIGSVTIDKLGRSYGFAFNETNGCLKFLPPFVYGLNEGARTRLLKDRYDKYGYAPWSVRIHKWAMHFINRNRYPDVFPP